MTAHAFALALALAALAALGGGCSTQHAAGPGEAETAAGAAAIAPPAGSSSASAPKGGNFREDRALYRLDFTVTTTDPGKPPSATSHTMNLEENMPGEIRVGQNVSLQTFGGAGGAPMMAPRVDVGLLIRGIGHVVKEGLMLDVTVEQSSVDESHSIRKLSTKGNALVAPGKPTLVTSTEEPSSHRKIEVTVTATKLR